MKELLILLVVAVGSYVLVSPFLPKNTPWLHPGNDDDHFWSE